MLPSAHIPCLLPLLMMMVTTISTKAGGEEFSEQVEHHYVTNQDDGTRLHYVSIGEGPLVLFLHGFPDFWYSWNHQMRYLASDYRCAALDLRGYNLSDKPVGVESYDMSLLVKDVLAVIDACGVKRATVVGHDWGGAVAWSVAMNAPSSVDKLIICNLPHPRGLQRELLINDEHRANTKYARDFQDPEYHKRLSPDLLVTLLKSLSQKPWSEQKTTKYLEAFHRSDFQAMLSYYRQNYNPELQEKPKLPYEDTSEVIPIRMPVLIFHGLMDRALHHRALNNTWEWVEQDLTIVTLPQAGHWVHHDAPDVVSTTVKDWLVRHP